MTGILVSPTLRFAFSGLLLVVAAGILKAQDPAQATNTGAVQLNFGSHYGPATAAAQQIQAEAQYLKAYGEMQKDLAQARIRHAQARALEGANSVQAVRDHILKRNLIEAERDRRIGQKLAQRHKQYERTLERFKNHPELNAGEIVTGVALNFLKNRLSSKVVTFRADSMGSQEAVRQVSEQLRITPDIVHALQVRQNLPRGESFVFRLDEGQALQVDWWPPALRDPDLKAVRTRFLEARAAVYATGETSQSEDQKFDNIGKLIVALDALEEAYLNSPQLKKRFKTGNTFAAYLEGKAFLQTLGAEIRRMDRTAAAGPGQSLAFRGDYLPDLLAHVVRNGLEFAPARPGEEQAYQQVFHMLRDLWVAVENDADQPEASTDAVIPPTPERLPLP